MSTSVTISLLIGAAIEIGASREAWTKYLLDTSTAINIATVTHNGSAIAIITITTTIKIVDWEFVESKIIKNEWLKK